MVVVHTRLAAPAGFLMEALVDMEESVLQAYAPCTLDGRAGVCCPCSITRIIGSHSSGDGDLDSLDALEYELQYSPVRSRARCL